MGDVAIFIISYTSQVITGVDIEIVALSHDTQRNSVERIITVAIASFFCRNTGSVIRTGCSPDCLGNVTIEQVLILDSAFLLVVVDLETKQVRA